MFALIFRLGWLQIVEGERYQSMANQQHTSDFVVPSKRGAIYDRNGKELALTTVKNRIWANPMLINDPENASELLAQILDVEKEEMLARLTQENTTLVSIARRVNDDVVEEIKDQGIRGIWFVEDNERNYPYGSFATYVLGHTTDDGRGIAGIEQRYDKELSGNSGRSILHLDGARRQLPFYMETHYPPTDGVDIILTIDEVVQHYTERAATQALNQNNAERVIALVMDVNTGEILSMAVKPDYDPNSPRIPLEQKEQDRLKDLSSDDRMNYWFEMWRNPVFQEIYEPGSVFKVITTAASLEENIATPQTSFYSDGTIEVGGTTIRSWRWYNPFGEQTLAEAVKNSDNPIFVKLAQALGKDKLFQYLYSFGFNEPTGVDYPGEISSLMYSKDAAGPVEMATISFGQGISVTPIRMLTSAISTINGGHLLKPRLVRGIRTEEGTLKEIFEPEIIRQTVSGKTSAQMREILDFAITEESLASVPGYRIGGKTGTAQKVVDGRYVSGKYVSSFFGFYPVNEPEIALLVLIDEPRAGAYYGGEIAAPVAGEIFKETLRHLDYKPDLGESESQVQDVIVPEIRDMTVREARSLLEEHQLVMDLETQSSLGEEATVIDLFPKPGTSVPINANIITYTGYEADATSLILVPDLRGKTIREVNTIIGSRDLQLKITGSGLAVEQSPSPGTFLEPGSLINVRFAPD
ncbi:MAG: PASTA domain-containing protein [Tindallia sp. MSAO_Bac2]|nr:MAG: PASTA domain-containing protein [Tindallia sp. MSAO_Bac2]